MVISFRCPNLLPIYHLWVALLDTNVIHTNVDFDHINVDSLEFELMGNKEVDWQFPFLTLLHLQKKHTSKGLLQNKLVCKILGLLCKTFMTYWIPYFEIVAREWPTFVSKPTVGSRHSLSCKLCYKMLIFGTWCITLLLILFVVFKDSCG